MSILDDFINRKNSPSAVDYGKSLLGQTKKRGRRDNLLMAVGLGLKLKNHLHQQNVVNDLEEFSLSQAPKRAGLVAEWTKQTAIHALDERLKNENGDNLNFYFNKKARENWESLTGYQQPDISSNQFSDYQDWVANESTRLSDNHQSKLKGAPLGKLSKEEATADFDRIVRATTKAGLAPSNVNWFRGVIDNALGKGNDAKPNLDAISTHLDSLKGKPNSLNTPITSGGMQVSTRDNRDFAESYVPDTDDIDMTTLINRFKTTYGNLDVTSADIAQEISNIQTRNPRATTIQIENILLTKSYAKQIETNAEQFENAKETVAKYLAGDRNLSSIQTKTLRLTNLKSINDAFNVLINRNDTDASTKEAATLFSQQHGAELLNLPKSSEATRDDKISVAERVTTLIDRGQTTTTVQDMHNEQIALDTKNGTQLKEGMYSAIANQISQFSFDYPSININNNTVKNRLVQVGLLKYSDADEVGAGRITLDNYYEMLYSEGEIPAEEYLKKFSTIVSSSANNEEITNAQTTALEIVMDSENRFTVDEKEAYKQEIIKVNNLTEEFLKQRIETGNVEEINEKDEVSDGFTYQDVLDTPAIGPIANFAFGEEFGDSLLDYVMFLPIGGATFKLTTWAGKKAFTKALPFMGKETVKKLMASPYYSKLIKEMKLKNNIFTRLPRKLKNDPKNLKKIIEKQTNDLKKYRDGLNDYERAIYDSMNMKTGEINGTRLIKRFMETKGTKLATFVKKPFLGKDGVLSKRKILLYGVGGAAVSTRGYQIFNEDE